MKTRKIYGDIIAAVTISVGVAWANDTVLSPRAELEMSRLDQAAAAAQTYPSIFITNVNTGASLLSSITVTQDVTVAGQTVIALSAELTAILPLFQGFIFETSGDVSDISWRNGKQGGKLGHWWGGNTGKFACFVPKKQHFAGNFELIVAGHGTIETLRLSSAKGISLAFDTEPQGIPGSGDPVLDVPVSINATRLFAVSGICDFDRKKYMRVYGLADGPADFVKASEYFIRKGFLPSRDAGKNPAEWNGKTRPDLRMQQKLHTLYPEKFDQVFCFLKWPDDIAPADISLPKGTGAPATNQFSAAAELSSTTVSNRKLVLGDFSGGPYCEVKNESDITPNWPYFANTNKYDAWQLLADFHNIVADTVKRNNPGWMVGGPSSCQPAVDLNNFQKGQNLLTFMDRTHGHLDYYSMHFYERDTFRLVQTNEQTSSYLFGRLDGILDLFRNKMYLQNDLKPVLVTEYGGSRGDGNDVGYWKFIRSANSLMMRFMQRPDCVEMAVPFVIPISFWSKSAPLTDSFQLFKYDAQGNMQLTDLHYFLDLWSDFQGRRIVAETAAPGVTVNALNDSNVVYLAINNLSQQRISVNINGLFGAAVPTAIEQTRLYIENGTMHFETNDLSGLTAVPLAFDETSIIKITLDRVPAQTELVNRQTFYADRIMQPTGSATSFIISCPLSSFENGKLRIALGRQDGFDSDLSVTINGRKPIPVSLAGTHKGGMYYGTVEIPVTASMLAATNHILVNVPDTGGIISSVVLENNYH